MNEKLLAALNNRRGVLLRRLGKLGQTFRRPEPRKLWPILRIAGELGRISGKQEELEP